MSFAGSGRSLWTQIWLLGWFGLASSVSVDSNNAQEANFDPILQVDAGGHTSRVMSVCFNSTGDELWSAGWDKTVRLWKRSAEGRWAAEPGQTIYLPLGPGRNGVIDNIAMSPDNRYLAIGGYSRISKGAKFNEPGVERALGAEQLIDQGAIYIYDRVTQSLKRMLGHRGPVRRLAFDPHSETPRLVSAGFESVIDASGLRNNGGLRLWDIVQLRQLAALENLPRPVDPALCFLPGSAGTRVIANWGDGKTYLWDTKNVVPSVAGQGSQLLATNRRGSWVVTGGLDTRATGQLTFWDPMQPGGLKPLPAAMTSLPSEPAAGGNLNFLPLAAVAFSDPKSQREYLAVAVLVWKPGPNNGPSQAIAYQLRTFEVTAPGNPSREVSRTELWTAVGAAGLGMPSIAGSEAANTLVVANGSDGQISTFQLDELIAGRPRRSVLNNRLAPIQKTNFVVRSEAGATKVGLQLQTGVNQSFVLDISKNEISRLQPQGWENFDASVIGWKVERDSSAEHFISSNGPRRRLQLPADVAYVTSLFVAPSAKLPPCLVVAGEEQGQPWLGVFQSTGELVRLLTGHTNRILHLAGARDGRFVVSTGADQTVCLWDLSRPGELVPRHSALSGVTLAQAADGIVVESAKPTTGLRTGDKVMAMVDGQQVISWTTEQQVYDAVWNRRPGSSLTLRIQRGGASRDVNVVLQAAVEERKPVGQAMFIQTAASPEWIVWSPIGYYDVSSLDVRSHLGWLFNPATDNERVSFVATDKYPKLFVPGLLAELWTEPDQDLSKISLLRMNPAFDLVLAKPVSPRVATDGSPVVETPPENITLALTNDFPIESLDAPELFLNGKSLGKMTADGFLTWRAPPQAFDNIAPGSHTLLAKTTASRLSRTFETELKFQFVPPPPSIALVTAIEPHTKSTSTSFKATIQSGYSKGAFEAILEKIDDRDQASEVQRWPAADKLTIDMPLELVVGLNRFRLTARNKIEPSKNEEAAGNAELTFTLQRHALDTSPPEFSEVAINAPEQAWPVPQAIDNRRSSYQVPYDTIVLSGKVAAKELLTEAKLGEEVFQAFRPRSSDTFEFSSKVSLKPGTNRIELAAATAGNASAKEELLVEYRPPLPRVRIEFPPADYEVSEFQLRPQVQLVLSADWVPFAQGANIEVLVNGNPSATHSLANEATTSFEDSLPLQVGKNNCQIRIRGIVDERSETVAVDYDYLPAPEVDFISAPETTREAQFQLTASGRAGADIDRVLIDDQEIPKSQWRSSLDESKFNLQVTATVVEEGSQNRTLTIYSRGIPNPATKRFVQPTNLGPIQPPVLAWLAPNEGAALTMSTSRVKFEVRSTEPLTRLLLNDLEVAPAERTTPAPGVYVVERNVSLLPGANVMRVSAENAGGSGLKELVLQRLLPPGYVEKISIELADQSIVQPTPSSEAEWRFDKALPTGKDLTLRFTVLNAQAGEVWIAMNGFRRRAVPVPATAKSGHVEYRCPLVLTRERENVIEIVPTLPTAQVSRTRVKIDCLAPSQPKQRLHLALIGIGVTNEKEFIDSAVESLSGSSLRRTDARLYEFKASAFEHCFAYGPYAGNEVSRGIINYVLTNDIPNNISRQASDPSIQDVVLFYYRGGEQVSHAGEFYLTTQTQNPALDSIMRSPRWLQNRAISSTYLSGVMNELQGAHVMMLDVARMDGEPAGAAPVVSSFAPHAATYRFAWTRPNIVPNDARLMTALSDAFQRSDNLARIEQELGREHAELNTRYTGAIRYEHNTPAALRALVMRQ